MHEGEPFAENQLQHLIEKEQVNVKCTGEIYSTKRLVHNLTGFEVQNVDRETAG